MSTYGIRITKMKFPYIFVFATWLPLFLIAFFVPEYATQSFFIQLDNFIDHDLFGNVGMWSSAIPLTSKIIVNYICIFGPFFAFAFCYLFFTRSSFETSTLEDTSKIQVFIYLLGWTILLLATFYVFYLSSIDISNNRRLSAIGKDTILYAVYSAGMLFLYYVFALVSCLVYRVLPRALFK